MTEPVRAVMEVNGVRLQCEAMGRGDPLVFVHGGGADLRYWRHELRAFAPYFHALAYSRRHAPPNANPPERSYNALVDAADLAALLESHGCPAHVVAASIGACAALFVAARSPSLVRSLVLAEPPMLRWAQRTPAGAALFTDFMRHAWERARVSFAAGGRAEGMRALLDYFVAPGTYDRLAPAIQARVLDGASDWDALTASDAPFPPLDEREVGAITVPVLLLRAERTLPIHSVVDDELARMLSAPETAIITGASHDMWADQPVQCRVAAMRFLSSSALRSATPDPVTP